MIDRERIMQDWICNIGKVLSRIKMGILGKNDILIRNSRESYWLAVFREIQVIDLEHVKLHFMELISEII